MRRSSWYFSLELHQSVAVVESSLGIVDGARADNDKQSALGILALDNGNGFITALDDCVS